MDYYLITFASTHGAMLAQKILSPVCPIAVMPVLREISRGCGIAVRFPPEQLEKVRAALRNCPLPPAEYAFYGVTGTGPALTAEPLGGEKKRDRT